MTLSRFTHIATSTGLSWVPYISADGRYLAVNGYNPSYFIDADAKSQAGALLIDLDTSRARVIAPASADGKVDPDTRVYGITGDAGKVLLSALKVAPMALAAGSAITSYFIESTDGRSVAAVAASSDGVVTLSPMIAAMSSDGQHVVVQGTQWGAGLPVATGVFEADLRSGQVRSIAASPYGNVTGGADPVAYQVALSADGGVVVYGSRIAWSQAGADGYHDLMAYDAKSGHVVPVNTSTGGVLANNMSVGLSISGNGRYVAFSSSATNLIDDGQARSAGVYVKDLQTGAIVAASTDASRHPLHEASLASIDQALSDDGRYLVFESTDNLDIPALNVPVPAGGFAKSHVFVKDMWTGDIELVNSTPDTIGLNAHGAAISGNGQVIVFQALQQEGGDLAHPTYLTYAVPLPAFRHVATDDVLHGTAGIDALAGGLGDDTYYVNDPGDIVIEYAGGGIDTVHASVSYTLSDDVENLVLDGALPIDATGNRLDNVLTGNAGNNVLRGGDGNDVLTGGGGGDILDGGAGIDTARFAGKMADYAIADGMHVAPVAGQGGAFLTSIERLQFDDMTLDVTFDTGGVNGQIYRLYRAAFDRTPDAGGIGFWMSVMQRGGNLDAVAQQFIASDEFKATFGGQPSNASFVGLLYQHVLHRPADAAGAAFWTDVLDRHAVTMAGVLEQFSDSPENQAAVVGVLQNGIVYQAYHG